MIKTKAALLIALGLVSTAALAAPKTYTIKAGEKSPQLAQVESKTEAETFTGKTAKVTGRITFDAAKKTGSGRIVVDVKSIDTGIPLRNEHMAESRWLDAGKFPTIVFETTQVKRVSGDQYAVTGKYTMKGVTKTVTTTATVKLAKASAATRQRGFKGDVVQIRTSFNVKLADHGVVIAGQAVGKVSETVRISLTAYADAS
jgi:polyisoprenoid-binding protein YceI